MDKVEEFINEYEELCKKHQLYIDATAGGSVGIFKTAHVESEFDEVITRWRNELKGAF